MLKPVLTATPTRTGVDIGETALAKWSSLSPLAQMSLAFSRPGTVNAPFVEANGTPSRTPTTIIHGELEWRTSVPNSSPPPAYLFLPTDYQIILNCPQLGYSTDTPAAGLFRVPRGDSSPITLFMNQGEAFSSVYGASTPWSRYKILAQSLDLTFSAPEATLAGTVFIGSMQVSAMNGATVTALLDNCTTSFPLKDRCAWSLRSFISDRSLVHETCTLSSVADEWISYCVISKAPSVNITTGAAADYGIYVKAHANVLWNPVVSTPVMNGIALRPPDSVAPPPKAQLELANIVQSRAAEPQPVPKGWLAKTVSVLAAGASAASHFTPWAAPLAAGLAAAGGLLEDPRAEVPNYVDRMARLADIMQIVRRFEEGDESDEAALSECLEAGNRLYGLWESKQKAANHIQDIYDSCKIDTTTTRRGKVVKYRRHDGSLFDHRYPNPRSASQGQRENSVSSQGTFSRI